MPFDGTWSIGAVFTHTEANKIAKFVIAHEEKASAGASFDFQSISGNYAHLFLELYLRGDTAATTVNILLRLNNDSAANYTRQNVLAVGATATAAQNIADTSIEIGRAPAANSAAQTFSATDALLGSYAIGTIHRNVVAMSGASLAGGSGGLNVYQAFGTWLSTAAVTRVTVLPSAGNWAAGSTATLYALKS